MSSKTQEAKQRLMKQQNGAFFIQLQDAIIVIAQDSGLDMWKKDFKVVCEKLKEKYPASKDDITIVVNARNQAVHSGKDLVGDKRFVNQVQNAIKRIMCTVYDEAVENAVSKIFSTPVLEEKLVAPKQSQEQRYGLDFSVVQEKRSRRTDDIGICVYHLLPGGCKEGQASCQRKRRSHINFGPQVAEKLNKWKQRKCNYHPDGGTYPHCPFSHYPGEREFLIQQINKEAKKRPQQDFVNADLWV